jgi:hypothetical protein
MSDMGQNPAHAAVLITGGTGTLGSQVAPVMQDRGCQVRGPEPPRAGRCRGVQYVTADLATGAGAGEAVAGTDVIVHCASARKGDIEATQHLVTAELARAGRPTLSTSPSSAPTGALRLLQDEGGGREGCCGVGFAMDAPCSPHARHQSGTCRRPIGTRPRQHAGHS